MIVRVAGRALVADPRSAWRAVRLEASSTPRGLKAWLGILGILVFLGAIGAVRSITPGDKGIATTPTFEWGFLIVGYVFFAVTTSGLCLASSLGTVFGIERFRPLEKRHAVLAVLCLVTAFGVIALDLHYPVRLVLGAALNPSPTSPMWWMGVFYGIYLCFLLVEVWSMFRGHPRIHGMACVLSSGMAIIAPTTLGAVFAVVSARPYWAEGFTPLLMLASALLSGTALLGVVFGMVDRLHLTGFERAGALAIPAIRSLLTIALVIVVCLVAREVVVGLSSTDPGLSSATKALIIGPLAPSFVGVRVVIGLLLPLALLVVPFTRTPLGLVSAGCLAIVGVFADRLTFVSAGQIAPLTATSGVVSAPYATYTPSLVEISILIGAAAFIALLYTLAERYLDLRESEVHIGLALPVDLGAWWRGRSGGGHRVVAEGPDAVVVESAVAAIELPIEPAANVAELVNAEPANAEPEPEPRPQPESEPRPESPPEPQSAGPAELASAAADDEPDQGERQERVESEAAGPTPDSIMQMPELDDEAVGAAVPVDDWRPLGSQPGDEP